jgi:tripartite-type tricarboxylate transporter receptor subunit TctC
MSTVAMAQGYPNKPVKIIVPFSAGGLTDVLARGLGEELGRKWKQPVIVDNRPGANTIIGARLVADAAPDGYTILMANDPTLSANQYLYSKLPYDPVNDFTPVINLVKTEQILVTNKKSPYRTLEDLVNAAKKNPGKITYGSYGVGSKAHLDTEAFAKLANVKFNHIPYKGVADVVVGLLSGQIDFGLTGISPVLEHIKSGNLHALAISSPERRSLFPDLPTFAEKGMPEFESVAWFGLVVPKGTPSAIIDKIAADASQILRRPEFEERYVTGVGLELANQGPVDFASFLTKDRKQYEERIRAANVKLDY